MEISKTDLARASEAIAENKKILEARPTKRDVVHAFGEQNLKQNGSKWAVDINGRAGIEKLRELRRPSGKLAAERGQKVWSQIDTASMVGPRGDVVHATALTEDILGHKGYRRQGRWGRPNLRCIDGVWYRRHGNEWRRE